MKKVKTIRYKRGSERCPKCSGRIMYEGTATRKMPVGFGFVGSRFQIDTVVYKGFMGDCMECDTRIFAVKSTRHVTKFPRLKGAKR